MFFLPPDSFLSLQNDKPKDIGVMDLFHNDSKNKIMALLLGWHDVGGCFSGREVVVVEET